MERGLVTAHQRHLKPSLDRNAALWSAVDRIVDRTGDLDDLSAHGLHLFAVRRWRELSRDLPTELVDEERRTAAVLLAAAVALERARAAYDGTMLLMKGLEIAERYPNRTLRPLRDVDVLVDRPDRAQRALVAAGFEPLGEDDGSYTGRHHLRPLHLPGLPIVVEIHRRPQWVSWAPSPSLAELVSEARPSATGVDGVLAPSAAHHALLVATHSWAAAPLRRILDLVDVTLLAEGVGEVDLTETASRWQVDGVWKTTAAAAEAVFFDGPALPWHVRLWAGDPSDARDRTVLSNHVRRIASAFAALPVRRAVPVAVTALGHALGPTDGETWRVKLRRTGRAIRHAFHPLSRHSRGL